MAKAKGTGSFGARLANLREKEGFSLEELGSMTGMKPAYLARLEADKELPPVAEIMRLARVLHVDASVFLEDKPAPGGRRHARQVRTTNYAYETLTPEEHDNHLMGFRVKIDPESAHSKVGYKHEGEEFIYVLEGKLKLKVGGKTSTLKAGESIHFDSGLEHHLSNPGKEPTVLVVVLYAP